ncbi:phosphatase PAP2 family protein [Salinibacterium sp. G-O1]|uniref:phosphatase PAP2 family protein n=1 Tax=Salinibacterium sp. G-O1 TaxID=3046208 RepID=UPI0024B9EF03|nr:phosphatase PAP2 family protein [Salinibacterium sp. G-O1]MDJ0334037.1 phosphatase PAP2 family protein [Salinibacterium sp. G-O1]
MTQATEKQSRLRAFHEKFLVEVREVPASTKRKLYTWSAVLIAVGVTGFVTLLVLVASQGEVPGLDKPFHEWLISTQSGTVTSVMIWLAVIFGPVSLPIIALVVVIAWSFFSKHFWRPLLLIIGLLAGLIVVQVVTRLVGRERPPLDQMLFGSDMTPSFPSGHVAGAADFMLLIAYLVFSRRERPRIAAISFTVAVILIFIAGISRIYLGYHWPSDALASVFLSLTVLGGIIALDTHRTMRVTGEKR